MTVLRSTFARARLGLVALLFGAVSGQALAQSYTYSLNSTARPDLGTVSSGATGDTVFDITTGGVISKVSGTGARISAGTSIVTVTVSCGSQNACGTATIAATITRSGTPTGRAGPLGNFDVGGGTATITNKVIGSTTTTFTIGTIGKNSSKTFNVGMDFPIKATGSTGVASSSFTLSFDPNAGNDFDTLSGAAKATTVRSISIDETSALSFGSMVRPGSGSSTVTISAVDGARSFTGSAVGIATPTATRATYTVEGEGARAISINVPTSITLTRAGGGTLTVTTTKTFSGTPTLSGSAGRDGSYSFGVGGSMPITSSTTTGAYTGTFTITATYN